MPVTRLNTITYASVSVGGTDTNRQLHDAHVAEFEYGRLVVSFTVVVLRKSLTVSAYRSLYQALESAYRTPNGDLTVNLGGSDVIATAHDSNSGFNARPSIRLLDDEFYSQNSRAYRCSVEVQLPADEAGKDGRLSSNYSVQFDSGDLRLLTIEASYTALGSNSASEQVAAAFPGFVSAVQGIVTGNWERLSYTPANSDDEDKNARVTAVYGEVQHRKSLALFNDPDFIKPQLQVRTAFAALEQLTGSGAVPPAYVVCEFSTKVIKTKTDLRGLINSKVIPLLLAEAQAYSMAEGSLIPVESTLSGDPHNNTIQGRVAFSSTSTNLLRVTMTVTQVTDPGRRFADVLTGAPWDKELHLVPATRVRSIRVESEEIDVGQSIFAEHEVMTQAKAGSGPHWHLIEVTDEGSRQEQANELPDGGSLQTVRRASTHVLFYGVIDGGGEGTRTRQRDRLATGELT